MVHSIVFVVGNSASIILPRIPLPIHRRTEQSHRVFPANTAIKQQKNYIKCQINIRIPELR